MVIFYKIISKIFLSDYECNTLKTLTKSFFGIDGETSKRKALSESISDRILLFGKYFGNHKEVIE